MTPLATMPLITPLPATHQVIPCRPMDPSNPNAGKVLLPTPSMDPVCSPAAYDHSQPLVDIL